jgi:hypothetical protein
MQDMNSPSKPDWTRWCKGADLMKLAGMPYRLRESEDPDSPWRSVATTQQSMFSDPETSIQLNYMSVAFYGGGERVINESDDVEIGLIRPPGWREDAVPSEWPPFYASSK